VPVLEKSILLYLAAGILIQLISGHNYLPHCFWKTVTGMNCPGCGLTTALIKLIKLDIYGAWKTNNLIFIIFPFICIEGYKIIINLSVLKKFTQLFNK
jgi:Protein of unknown function (DUF2752)